MNNTDSFAKPTAEDLVPPPAYQISKRLPTPTVVEVRPARADVWGYYVDVDVVQFRARDRRRRAKA